MAPAGCRDAAGGARACRAPQIRASQQPAPIWPPPYDDQHRRSDRRDARGASGGPAGGDLVHRRDRRPADDGETLPEAIAAVTVRRTAPGVLRGRLRPPGAFRRRAGGRVGLGAADSRNPRERVDAQPRGLDEATTLDAATQRTSAAGIAIWCSVRDHHGARQLLRTDHRLMGHVCAACLTDDMERAS